MNYGLNSNTMLRRKLYSAVSMLLVSAVLLSSTSYAWLILSRRPEVSAVATNISANGSLEIALGKDIGESAVGDSSKKGDVTAANRTWGNLIDLTDDSYGLQTINLRPALLNAAGGTINTLHPFAYPVYGTDGRVARIYANNMFNGTYNGGSFVTSATEYGVRGIGTTAYIAPGDEDTFGPLSQRQEVYYYACAQLWGMAQNSYKTLCGNYQSVLMNYCYNGTGVSTSEFDLDAFVAEVEEVVSAFNEELRFCFAALAAAETTSPASYHAAIELLEDPYPNYEAVQSMVSSTAQTMGTANLEKAIAELRAFQDTATRLKAVIASDDIDGSDGYSREEIEQTVGLIFDLERTSFSENGNDKDYYFYSSVQPELIYRRYTEQLGNTWYWYSSYSGSIVNNLAGNLYGDRTYQDNDSREAIAADVFDELYPLCNSLRLGELDKAIAELYASHWDYWEGTHTEYSFRAKDVDIARSAVEALKSQLESNPSPELEAELQLKTEDLEQKEKVLKSLLDEAIYAYDDSRVETIRSVMTDTIETMRQYTLWTIAYFACDGQVPDDAYQRMLEIANSSAYTHPRTAYRALCNYGVTPPEALTQMVEAYDRLEEELLFLQRDSGNKDKITWPELESEFQRLFGTITHTFRFYIVEKDYSYSYNHSYSPIDPNTPTGVTEILKDIRKEIEDYETAVEADEDYRYCGAEHQIRYGSYEENPAWSQSLGLLTSLIYPSRPFDYGTSEYILEDQKFNTSHSMYYVDSYYFDITVGVGSEDNFNESGLTVRQTRFQTAQNNISYYQNQLITAAVNADQDVVNMLMQMIGGQNRFMFTVLCDYLDSLQQQLDYAEAMMYNAALAMAASDYARDEVYRNVYSGSNVRDAAGVIELLRQSGFDAKVLDAFDERMAVLNDQQSRLAQSRARVDEFRDPETGAFLTDNISVYNIDHMLKPVLDFESLTLYGYVAQERYNTGNSGETVPTTYTRTVLYAGFESEAVKINGNQATVGSDKPVTLFGDVYLSVGRSLSGSLLAFAKTQVETYAPPAGSVKAEDIQKAESGMNRYTYAVTTDGEMFALNLRTADDPYALSTNLWEYTGNTKYISAGNVLVELYGYCIDLSFRTNAPNSNLLLQTDAINRIYDDSETLTDTAMGAGSYMEFTLLNPAYTVKQGREYMSCVRAAITDTNTGYIYGYAALDMDAAEVSGTVIKAPLRLINKNIGKMLDGDAEQYLCNMDQNQEKNITVYVYLDGAKTSSSIVSADAEQSMSGVMNLQFCSSADLKPAVIESMR